MGYWDRRAVGYDVVLDVDRAEGVDTGSVVYGEEDTTNRGAHWWGSKAHNRGVYYTRTISNGATCSRAVDTVDQLKGQEGAEVR